MKKLVALILCAIMMLPVVNSREGLDVLRTNLIVTLQDNDLSSAEALNEISKIEDLTVTYSDRDFIIASYEGTDARLKNITDGLETCSAVLFVERDAASELCALTDDKYSSSQYWLDNNGKYTHFQSTTASEIISKKDVDIDGPEGWAEYKTKANIEKTTAVVAIIDTGVDYKHADLAGAMWTNPKEIPDNGIDDDGNGYVDDVYGWDFYNGDASVCHYAYNEEHDMYLSSPYDNDNHGTHCAGIIAAVANNSIGIAGAASCADVKIMSLKVHGGPDRSGTNSDVIRAIRYADMMGANVCNISWGAYNYSAAICTAIERSNMLFVCAAGNDGIDNDVQPLYPASYDLDNIISVTYLETNGTLPLKANYGATSVDVAAPAVDVFSTIVGSYGLMSGSSMAAPQVSAIAGVLYTLGRGLYARNVRDVIFGGVKPIDSFSSIMTHAGIPSLYGALKGSDALDHDTYAPILDVELKYRKGDLVLQLTTADIGDAGINSVRYFTGRKDAAYFAGGGQGSVISGNKLMLSKGGIYTFYIVDYAGNYTLKTLKIVDDLLPPTISNIKIRYDNEAGLFNIDAEVSDYQSDVRTVKYLQGVHDAAEFSNSTISALKPDEADVVHFTVAEEGTYTLYASDNRGNSAVSLIRAYKRPVTSLEAGKEKKNLSVGQSWSVKYDVIPEQTTDVVSFASSDETVATVSKNGRVRALAEGECVITITSTSGKTDECRIVVRSEEE